MLAVFTFIACLVICAHAFMSAPQGRFLTRARMADVEITFPNGKKTKAAAGSSLKEAAKKAGFAPNYGCEEGKCGSCELKVNGKTKIRPCIGKVPSSNCKLEE